MPIYKGLTTLSAADLAFLNRQLHDAAAQLDRSAQVGDGLSRAIASWSGKLEVKAQMIQRLEQQNAQTKALELWVKQLEGAIAAGSHGSRQVLAKARDIQATANAREPGRSEASAYIQGMGEGLEIGTTGVEKAFVGAGTGLLRVGADLASNVAAGAHGLADDLTGDVKDERKQVQKSNATYDRLKAAFEGATGSEEGGWLRSLVEDAGTNAGGQHAEAIAKLDAIPAQELAGLDPNSPHFSENMAGLGINIALFAVAARGSVLKAADNLDAQAAKLNATGIEADAKVAAQLVERARIYRRIAALPKYAEKARVAGKILASSPRLAKVGRAWKAANNFRNPIKGAKAEEVARAEWVNAAAVDAMKPNGKNTVRLGRTRTPDLPDSAAQEHRLTFNAAAGKMELVDPSTFRNQMSQNRGAATLTPYTDDELASIELFKLKDGDVYYGIKPIDIHPITGQPERDVVAVMNNGPRAKGLAIPAVMLHTIENGATTLDAFDVHGFLPDRYRQFGFHEIARQHYNSAECGEPSDDLKSAWRQDSWKDEEAFPDVVYMKFGGSDAIQDSVRSSARRNYLESWAVDHGATRSIERNATGGLLYNDGRDSGAVRSAGVRAASASPGRPDAQIRPNDSGRPVGHLTGFARRYDDLLGLPDNQLARIGLAPWEVRALPEPRFLPDRPGVAQSVLPDPTDTDLTTGQSGKNLFTIPWLLLQSNLAANSERNAAASSAPHQIPPSPPTPVGPTRSPSVLAGLRAMRNEAL